MEPAAGDRPPEPWGSAEDLRPDVLVDALPGRPLRTYPALLSTHADALAWGRAGAPRGAVVVADYQVAPRGRGGLRWEVPAPGQALGCSLLLRPGLPPEREGWLYSVAVSGLADVVDGAAVAVWPDEVRTEAMTLGMVAVHAELGPTAVEWAVVTVLLPQSPRPRGPQLAALVDAIERRAAAPPEQVLDDYRSRCATLGRTVRAGLMPPGPAGPEVIGTAVDLLSDGAMVVETSEGRRIAVRPQHLGLCTAA